MTNITDPLGGGTKFALVKCVVGPHPHARRLDGNGNLLTLTDARGKTTTWTYDDMDRVATRTDPLNRTESFTYDLNGSLKMWTGKGR